MSNKTVMFVAVVSLLLSVSGWGMFLREKARQEEMKEKLADYVLAQVEERKKMEESIKDQLRQKKQEQEVVMQLEYERQLQDTINNQLKQYEQDREEFINRRFDDFRSWTGGLVKQELSAFSGSIKKPLMEKLREYGQLAEETAAVQSAALEKRMAAYKEELGISLRSAIEEVKEEMRQEFARQRAEARAAFAKQKEELDRELRHTGETGAVNAPGAAANRE